MVEEPQEEQGQTQIYYRCGQCTLNWPNVTTVRMGAMIPEYARCPKCNTPTAVMNAVAEVMTPAEAASLVRHLKFDEFLEHETVEQRDRRHLEWEQSEELRRAKDKADFAKVIDEAGFDSEEAQRIMQLEERLPKAHI